VDDHEVAGWIYAEKVHTDAGMGSLEASSGPAAGDIAHAASMQKAAEAKMGR